ncbi:MAG: efflux RND transporter permease subunit [Candidatus Omnitrophica bacterium]|nr:efflux RND transporter permease subunit [Candidatus Omnitrophota bacterium]
MSLPRFSVHRPVTTIMIYVAVLLMGVIAWTRLPQELYPPITYPQLTVVTRYKDAAPEEIELLVTKPIEEAVGTVSGLRRISSVSREEVSLVIAEFNWNSNMDFAALGVREKIDLIKERLPRGSEDPVVVKFNPFELPVLVLNLSGGLSSHELLELARKQIKNELEKVDGVAAVNISGGLEREIQVEVDQGRLQAAGLPISQVVDSLSKTNLNYPGGTIKEAFYEYLIRTMGEFQVVPEIPSIAVGVDQAKGKATQRESGGDRPGPLKREKGLAPSLRMILLKDVATVKDTFKEKTSVSRFNGAENISLNIQKQAGANTVQVASRMKQAIARVQSSLPPGVQLTIAYDQSLFIKNAISGVRDAAIQGGVLAFIVLYLFLGNPWASLNVAAAIPISVLATIGLMYFSGTTINIISMGGLALGVGLLVDAGIVVVENIDRYRSKGKPPPEAAVQGTEEVGPAVIGSILTNVVVFLPMVFVSGIVGQLFKDLAYTVTWSNLVSLAVSLTLTALFASWIRHGTGRSPIEPAINAFLRFDMVLVQWFIRHRFLGIGIVLLLFGGSVVGFGKLDREVLPKADQGQFNLRINLSPGTRLEVTDRVAQRVEKVLQAVPEVRDVTVTIGSSKEKKAEEMVETLGSHQAAVFVTLKPLYRGWRRMSGPGFRTRRSAEIVRELKDTLSREPLEGAEIEYLLQESAIKSSVLASAPVVVEVRGTELPQMEQLTGQVQKLLGEIPGLYGVQTSLVPPSPETKVHVNKDRASAYHLSVSDIALTTQTALKGTVATKFKEAGKEIDIRVRLRKQDREDLNKVRRLLIHSPLEIDVPLAEIAYLAVGKGPTEIKRLDQQRTILISAQLFQRPLNEVIQDVNQSLRVLRIPSGYTVALTGENEQMKESFQSLIFALGLAVILIYMVMAAEFESLWEPFLIMATIPMSLIGVTLGLWVTHTPVSVMVAIGFILLGGIVVNNGIVLIEYVNLLRKEGKSAEEAVIQASQTRLRPILMTAAAEVLGLLPLALGLQEGVELQGPMAITQMWGMTLSTFLTLIFLPTLYVMGENFFSLFSRVKAPELQPALLLATVPAGFPPPPPVLLAAPAPPEFPEIPEGFGGEEAVPEGPSVLFPLSAEPIMKPEPSEEPVKFETPASAFLPPLNPRQRQLLEYLKIHGRITRKDFVKLTGASVPTAARDLKELADRGLIVGYGPFAKGRYYTLAKSEGDAA